MKLSELMQQYAPNPLFTGVVTNDDNVLAVDIASTQKSAVDDFVVVQKGIIGVDSNMNAVTQDSQYIRTGLVTTKVGQQRTFTLTGDRFIGDEFQDYIFDPTIKYGVGEIVKARYVFFNLLNGKGEFGQASIIVNSDGSGNAGATASIDVGFNSTEAPQEYIYVPVGTLGILDVASTGGAAPGTSVLRARPPMMTGSGMKAVYNSDTTVTMPAYDDVLSGVDWKPYVNGASYSLDDGDEFVIAYITDADDKVRYAGHGTVTATP